MKRIAVFQNRPGIGDMCLFLPAIHAISKYNATSIYLFTKSRSKSKEFLKYDPCIKEIFYTDIDFKSQNFFSSISFLKKFNFEEVYIFAYGIKYPLLFKIAKTQKIFCYGFFKKNHDIFLDLKNLLNSSIGKNNYEINCKLYLKNQSTKELNSCVIGIGGSGPTKKWSIKNYKNLIDILKKRGFVKFIIAGGLDEIKDFNQLLISLPDTNFISLCEKSIDESIDEIAKASLYVGNDTGFMHLSGLCGLKTYGLFGDTPTNYVSYNPIIKTIIPEGYNEIGHNSNAIDKITVEKVIKDLDLD
jgi:heptosyltransferase-2